MAARSTDEIFQHIITTSNARQEGDSYRAICPCHDDRNESFYIARGDKGIKLHCHAGCSHVDLAYHFGVAVAELFDEEHRFATSDNPSGGGKRKSTRPPLGKLIASYDYTDEDGNFLYQVRKFDGGGPPADKQFRQCRRHQDGAWVWGLTAGRYRKTNDTWRKCAKGDGRKQPGDIDLPATETVLYRLPDLLSDPPTTATFIVEGEKDVERLRKLGLSATCNTGGASKDGLKPKWKQADSEALRPRQGDIYAIPDNDDAGRAHAAAICRGVLSLKGTAERRVAIVNLPGLDTKGDVSDWFDAGGTVDELLRLAAAAEVFDPDVPDKPTVIANYTEGGDGKEPLSMERIVRDIKTLTDDWPRRVSNALFVPSETDKVDWFDGPDELFGWLGLNSLYPPRFTKTAGFHTRGEVFQTFRRRAKRYDHIELYPHEPPFPNHYYAIDEIPKSDGSALNELLDFFSPATDLDRQLILAFFATLFWGGPCGKRPLFVITSDSGRGAGKTELVTFAGMIAGGTIDLSSKEDAEHIKQRILSPEGMRSRIALLDNVKSLNLSWAELEAFITCPSISGKRMYIGEARRPNQITWVITLNGASMGTDMAQRHAMIKLGKPKYMDQWFAKVESFITDNRQAIIADCLRFFTRPRRDLKANTRWGPWEYDVLRRLDDPDEIQALIVSRQKESNIEAEEGAIITEAFSERLENLNYSVGADRVWIPSKVAMDWYNTTIGSRNTVSKVSRILRQKITEREIDCLEVCLNTHRRGFVWNPEAAEDAAIMYDIETRIASHKEMERLLS